MGTEIETKFKVNSPAAIRKRLIVMRARLISRRLEKDVYYRCYLKTQNAEAIRLRSVGGKYIFTLKKSSVGPKGRIYKVCDEFEIEVNDGELFDSLLRRLGFTRDFKKEKIRETYKYKNAKVCLDRLPHMGYYVEIEASKRDINSVARSLKLDITKGLSDNYMRLFLHYKRTHKKPNLKLTF
ncbi:MAG: class IV adenylate cyclase [Candidatus Omnitrophica bacterium]|nr:class IV adenylate cyclase [Candidatus Omnitrophota bacterium]